MSDKDALEKLLLKHPWLIGQYEKGYMQGVADQQRYGETPEVATLREGIQDLPAYIADERAKYIKAHDTPSAVGVIQISDLDKRAMSHAMNMAWAFAARVEAASRPQGGE